ncbi:MAG: acylneuraminate cytidylyltransferase family protein [Caulobacter sp.]
MTSPFIAFLPCRAGSQRIPHKNTREFAGNPEGLVGIKLDQLLACGDFDKVVLSSNDAAVIRAGERRMGAANGKLMIDIRPDNLCSSSTSTDEVIAYVPRIIDRGHIVWTHVTSPFFGTEDYSEAIHAYNLARESGAHDSLMGVTRLNTFLWDNEGPINYDRKVERWPRTQTLRPIYEVNSAIFIAPVEVYRTSGDRIGDNPKLYEIEKKKTVDIDWPEDFEIAERLWAMG